MEQFGQVLEVKGKMASIYIWNDDNEKYGTNIPERQKRGRAVSAFNLINAREGQRVKLMMPAKNIGVLMVIYFALPLLTLFLGNFLIKLIFKNILSSESLQLASSCGAIILALLSGLIFRYLGKTPKFIAFSTPSVAEIIIRRK